MSTTLQITPIHAILLAQLQALDFPVGDGVLPPDSLWTGQPNVPGSEFTPFFVLHSLFASRSSGTFDDPQADWQLPYMVVSYGVSRMQCTSLADRGRSAFAALARTTITSGPDSYYVQQIRTGSINRPDRSDVTDPPLWSLQDGFEVWISKELSP